MQLQKIVSKHFFPSADPPGPASIIPGDPSPPLKGQRVELTCHVNDSGLPATNNFRWEHGLNLLNVTGHTLVTEPVTTTTQGNYSCAAVNKVGAGLAAHWVLDALGKFHATHCSSLAYCANFSSQLLHAYGSAETHRRSSEKSIFL